jgi:hypothetical protein
MKTMYKIGLMAFAAMVWACNDARPGQNTTDAGTQQSDNTVNAEMEDNRQAADVDTIVSPGSNALDHKQGRTDPAANESRISPTQTGTGSDPNMQGQSDTHGRDTKAGNK